MEAITKYIVIPEWIKPALALVLTASAALLYALILGTAIMRTAIEPHPVFSPGALRAAELLGGLVGSVVAAGFARGKQPAPMHPVAVLPGSWVTHVTRSAVRVRALARNKLLSLGEIMGLERATPPLRDLDELAPAEPAPAPAPAPTPSPKPSNPAAVAVGLLYLVVYVLIGAAALIVTISKATVPEIVSNSAWVWLGTVASATYSFFALGGQE
jgi:hypothetical protein